MEFAFILARNSRQRKRLWRGNFCGQALRTSDMSQRGPNSATMETP